MKAAIIILLAAATAHAEDLNLAAVSTDKPNIVSVQTGLDHGIQAELGYARVLALGDHLVLAGAELTFPFMQPDLGDWQIRLVGALPVLQHGGWKLAAQLRPTVRSADSALANMVTLGADASISGGFFTRRWFAALEIGLDWSATTHITNSMKYRTVVYADAEDGWYRDTGGTWRAGASGGIAFRSFDLVLRAGRPVALDGSNQSIPFYAAIGVNVAR